MADSTLVSARGRIVVMDTFLTTTHGRSRTPNQCVAYGHIDTSKIHGMLVSANKSGVWIISIAKACNCTNITEI